MQEDRPTPANVATMIAEIKAQRAQSDDHKLGVVQRLAADGRVVVAHPGGASRQIKRAVRNGVKRKQRKAKRRAKQTATRAYIRERIKEREAGPSLPSSNLDDLRATDP